MDFPAGPGGTPSKLQTQLPARPNLDPDAPDEGNEEGEEMEDVNDDDAAMMVMIGVAGFGSTKVLTLISVSLESYLFCTGEAS